MLVASCAQAAGPPPSTKQALRAWKHPWKQELERRGLVDYSVSSPYRVALPLTTIGDSDARLMLTYAHSMPGETGSKGPLLFVKITLD